MDTPLIPSRFYTAGNLIRELRTILTNRQRTRQRWKTWDRLFLSCRIVTTLQNGKRFASFLCMYPKFTYLTTHDETHVFKVVRQQSTYVNDNVCSYAHTVVCFVFCLPAELLSAQPKNNVVSLSPISMKSTKVCDAAKWWVGRRVCVYSRGLHASSWRRVWHGLATQVDSER